ncbi:MAG: histidine--tRNA ligase [Chitinophagales bacterium]|nr:histidine--tRNA ligase [Chitinophagales bacterium]
MMDKPAIPSGFRDFSSEEVYRRQHIFNTIRSVFEKYGYQPIETPTMENLKTLEGKYGDEGDKLLYRIVNSGDPFRKIKSSYPDQSTSNFNPRVSDIAEKGLRYDLTVPLARYVVMHQNEIIFPFKRYQIQPVFRADRPQKGRYREFYQCDADVVGSDSLLNEVELIQIYIEVFKELGIGIQIYLNNRKILEGIAEVIGAPGRMMDIAVSIDKLDKIGMDGVRKELNLKGFTSEQIDKLFSIQALDIINGGAQIFHNSETGRKGSTELEYILKTLNIAGGFTNLENIGIDLSLARGLDYYTGTIIEVKAKNSSFKSSLGGGGRYDNLTGVFGLQGISGVGISFGADRIYDVMEEQGFSTISSKGTHVLFINFDEASETYALPLLTQIRNAGIASELYPSAEKLKKQMKYANDKKISFVIFTGENERKLEMLTLKDMSSGEQMMLSIDKIIEKIK